MNEAIELDRELLARLAETHPGLVSTLSALLGQLESGDLPEPELLRDYGQMLCRLGATVIGRADRLEQPGRLVVDA